MVAVGRPDSADGPCWWSRPQRQGSRPNMRKVRTHTIVGLIADTHGLLRPEALDALRGCHVIVHAGDIGTPAVLEGLRQLAPLVAIRGNNDTGTWVRELPATAVVKA